VGAQFNGREKDLSRNKRRLYFLFYAVYCGSTKMTKFACPKHPVIFAAFVAFVRASLRADGQAIRLKSPSHPRR
jgi:hypothetical protein